jgi:hypothetical protein
MFFSHAFTPRLLSSRGDVAGKEHAINAAPPPSNKVATGAPKREKVRIEQEASASAHVCPPRLDKEGCLTMCHKDGSAHVDFPPSSPSRETASDATPECSQPDSLLSPSPLSLREQRRPTSSRPRERGVDQAMEDRASSAAHSESGNAFSLACTDDAVIICAEPIDVGQPRAIASQVKDVASTCKDNTPPLYSSASQPSAPTVTDAVLIATREGGQAGSDPVAGKSVRRSARASAAPSPLAAAKATKVTKPVQKVKAAPAVHPLMTAGDACPAAPMAISAGDAIDSSIAAVPMQLIGDTALTASANPKKRLSRETAHSSKREKAAPVNTLSKPAGARSRAHVATTPTAPAVANVATPANKSPALVSAPTASHTSARGKGSAKKVVSKRKSVEGANDRAHAQQAPASTETPTAIKEKGSGAAKTKRSKGTAAAAMLVKLDFADEAVMRAMRIERDNVQRLLRELVRLGALRVGMKIAVSAPAGDPASKLEAVLGETGVFVDRSGGAFPSMSAMQAIATAGGSGENTWAPVRIEGSTLVDWLARSRPAQPEAEADKAGETGDGSTALVAKAAAEQTRIGRVLVVTNDPYLQRTPVCIDLVCFWFFIFPSHVTHT